MCFGVVIGWITYRTLMRKEEGAAISDIACVVGAVGGGAVTTVFGSGLLFAWYSIGLAGEFFGYLIARILLSSAAEATRDMWLG